MHTAPAVTACNSPRWKCSCHCRLPLTTVRLRQVWLRRCTAVCWGMLSGWRHFAFDLMLLYAADCCQAEAIVALQEALELLHADAAAGGAGEPPAVHV